MRSREMKRPHKDLRVKESVLNDLAQSDSGKVRGIEKHDWSYKAQATQLLLLTSIKNCALRFRHLLWGAGFTNPGTGER